MNLAFESMLGLCLFCGLALLLLEAFSRASAILLVRSFAQIVKPRRTARRAQLAQSGWDVLRELLHVVRANLRLTDDPMLQTQFEAAAIPFAMGRDLYLAARFGGPVLMVLAGFFSPVAPGFAMCAGAGLAYLAPAFAVQYLVRRHRRAVQLAIPDAIDLLVICVDAGLGLDQAIARVAEELTASHPAIQHEFQQISREQRAGKPRIDAWREMARRTAVPEAEALVNMLMQTERFGTPIARALSAFGDTIRQKRRQKAEEMAAKTTVKIIFPLVFFIFPCIFIVLLGPAGIDILHSMAANR